MMKFIFTYLFIVASLASFGQQQLAVFTGEWEEAKAIAEEENKLIFIDFYADWCVTCKHMDQSVFRDEPIVDMLTDYFVFYKVNVDHFTGIELASKYQVTSLPTYVVTNAQGEEVDRSKGSTTIEKMSRFLRSLVS